MPAFRGAFDAAWSTFARVVGIPDAERDDLEAWRTRIFFGFSLGMVAFGIAPLVASAARALEMGGQGSYIAAIVALYLVLVAMALTNRIPMAIRIWTTLSLAFLLAVISLASAGLTGTGRTYLLAFVVMTTLLRGARGLWASLALSAAAMLTISCLVSSGHIDPSANVGRALEGDWYLLSLSLMFACSGVGAAVALLVRGLERLVTRLREEQARLDERVHERTRELQETMAELRASRERFLQLAVRDDLTGLYSRRFASETLSRAVEGLKRNPGVVSVLLLDLDHFKAINDTFGHAAGDKVLCAVARAIEAALRSTDTVARFGGEEFLVILPMTDGAGATLAAEKVRAAIEREVRSPRQVTASLGVSQLSWLVAGKMENSGELVAALLQRADEALYEAKRRGRNQAVASCDAC